MKMVSLADVFNLILVNKTDFSFLQAGERLAKGQRGDNIICLQGRFSSDAASGPANGKRTYHESEPIQYICLAFILDIAPNPCHSHCNLLLNDIFPFNDGIPRKCICEELSTICVDFRFTH